MNALAVTEDSEQSAVDEAAQGLDKGNCGDALEGG